MQKFLTRYHVVVLVAILAFAFVTRIYRLDEPKRYVFDEVYHAVTAKLIHQENPWAYEWWNPPPEPDTAVDWLHPPLAKYTQAMSMDVFGENSFGWRFSSVIFGVLVVFATYKLALTLFGSKNVALVAAALASLDGLLLVQSRVAMNDIHVTFFILLAFNYAVKYFRAKERWLTKKYNSLHFKKALGWCLATGGVAGLAMGTKWSGAYALMVIWVAEFVTSVWWWIKQRKNQSRELMLLFFGIVFLGLLPFLVYVSSYIHMFALGHSLICREDRPIEKQCYYEEIKSGDEVVYTGYFSHFLELHRQIWIYQTSLQATHPYQSRPGQWFLDARPVWYHVEYFDDGRIANIYAFGNPVLFWVADLGLVALVVSLVITFIRKRQLPNPNLLFLLFGYATVWLPWIASPRIMFFYHYTPAVPLMCIILSYGFFQLWHQKKHQPLKRAAIGLALLAILVTFFVWYPQWTGLPVSQQWADLVYFTVPSWK